MAYVQNSRATRSEPIPVTIDIVPAGVRLTDLADYEPEDIGTVFSTTDEILVNEVVDGYSILFSDEEVVKIQPHVLINNLLSIFRKNLPGIPCEFSINYYHELEDSGDEDDDDDTFSMEVGEFVLRLDLTFNKFMENTRRKLYTYERGESILVTAELYRDYRNDSLYGDEDDYDDDEEDDPRELRTTMYADHDVRNPLDPLGVLNEAIRGANEYDEDDDEDDERRPKRRRHRSTANYYDGYGSSHVLRSAKNPKRAYHRHGVLVCKSKSAIKKDTKILKEFLRDFIPGNAGWKKDLRKDLVKRWMRLYVVTSKQLKKLEREHRKMQQAKKKPFINTERTIELTRSLFTVPMDNWNNPNK